MLSIKYQSLSLSLGSIVLTWTASLPDDDAQLFYPIIG